MAKAAVKGRINEQEVFEPAEMDDPPSQKGYKAPPAYKIYKDAKIPVSKALGPSLKKKFDASIKAYDFIRQAWQEVLAYYNNNQVKGATTSTGHFRRGDSTENVVFSNLNMMIPAVCAKAADFAVNTIDSEDKPFSEALRHLLNALFKRRDYLNAKSKIKKAVGMGLLTNFGVFKIDYTKKDDSRETVIQEMEQLSTELRKAKTKAEVEAVYGKLLALEAQVQVTKKSGPLMEHVYPWHCLVDPNAEDQDGCDGEWMAEPCLISTDYLKARFMEQGEGDEWHLVFKPSHKVAIAEGDTGEIDSGMGAVMQRLSGDETQIDAYTDEERLEYQYQYMTECVWWWDKTTRRLYLFLKDDWSFPVWVWEDPLRLSRFFPYFNIPFAFSTGGPISVGETSYILDQQDEINEINKQVAMIRRIVFKYIFYDSETVTPEVAEKINKALRGDAVDDGSSMQGIPVPEGKKLADLLHALVPPSTQMEPLFNKEPILSSINRLTNTSDALRGVQFKTNTNEAAVQTYQDAVRLSVGAKVDSVEDALSDAGHAIAELCVQFMEQQEVAGIIGAKLAQGWRNMSVEEFNANYSCEVVAGSTEKPNSTFKKKEAVNIAQAVGQFAQAAPGTTLRIMLRVLQQAFSEVVITPDDWASLEQEVMANLSKGDSSGGTGGEGGEDVEALRNVPPQVKQKAMQMKQAGRPNEEILAFVKQQGQSGQAQPAKQEQQNAA